MLPRGGDPRLSTIQALIRLYAGSAGRITRTGKNQDLEAVCRDAQGGIQFSRYPESGQALVDRTDGVPCGDLTSAGTKNDRIILYEQS